MPRQEARLEEWNEGDEDETDGPVNGQVTGPSWKQRRAALVRKTDSGCGKHLYASAFREL